MRCKMEKNEYIIAFADSRSFKGEGGRVWGTGVYGIGIQKEKQTLWNIPACSMSEKIQNHRYSLKIVPRKKIEIRTKTRT